MYQFAERVFEYYNHSGFRRFQNQLAEDIYNALAAAYSCNANEVQTVTDMCKAMDGKSFDNFHFHCQKIHGSRSLVNFRNQSRDTTRELADMIAVSVITKQRKILYLKTAFIQNKKEKSSGNAWEIDQDQLYLLQNFPTFRGSKGLFRKHFDDGVAFLNHSEALGNYGLFCSPGEMVLINAKSVFALQRNDVISMSAINDMASKLTEYHHYQLPYLDPIVWEEVFYHYLKRFSFARMPYGYFPVLGDCQVTLNMHEFIRDWTYFNIGEVSQMYDYIIDEQLSQLTQQLLISAGLRETIDLNSSVEGNLDSDVVLIVSQFELGE